ncbi:Imm49 family immunity protein [Paenibacillus glacialis]|uniref:Uncharacterized protein n=1 Tax=Paenibacillus glacialis TaxID=494026 RepID=A0A168N8M4_9BACL|nr:Imm49 family immunity protein [Paenibacillus glacialis]OAB45521.1 hypothetical protein PGLA_04530 [Paenibacillus glacialis]
MAKYLQHFPEIFDETIEDTNERIQRYRDNGLPKNAGFYYELLADGFQDIAIGEIVLNGNVSKSKQSFYLAGKMQEVLYQRYDSKENDISSDYVTTDKHTRLLMALISGNEELINSLTTLFGGRIKEENEDHELHKSVGYAMKYILLGEIEHAAEYVAVLKKLEGKKSMKLYNGYAKVLSGIIENDKIQVNEGLKYMIECHKKLEDDYGNTPQELLSIPILGLAKLAIRNDIAIDIDDSLVPMILLEQQEINYPLVDFVE